MKGKRTLVQLTWAFGTALAVAGIAPARADQPVEPPRGTISDVGTFGEYPLGIAGRIVLDPEQKRALRRLEDKHIQELRQLEDRFADELRALRAKQYAEREAFFKSLAPR
jgi:hypothetical protein